MQAPRGALSDAPSPCGFYRLAGCGGRHTLRLSARGGPHGRAYRPGLLAGPAEGGPRGAGAFGPVGAAVRTGKTGEGPGVVRGAQPTVLFLGSAQGGRDQTWRRAQISIGSR